MNAITWATWAMIWLSWVFLARAEYHRRKTSRIIAEWSNHDSRR